MKVFFITLIALLAVTFVLAAGAVIGLLTLHAHLVQQRDLLCSIAETQYQGADGGGGFTYQIQQLCGSGT
jgi:hypothetical protein